MKFRDEQVARLLDDREKYDQGQMSHDEFIRTVKSSTALELDSAMTEYGGYEQWGHE